MVILVETRRLSLCIGRQETFEESHIDNNFDIRRTSCFICGKISKATHTPTRAGVASRSSLGTGCVSLPGKGLAQRGSLSLIAFLKS
jgi:hypothetical protein